MQRYFFAAEERGEFPWGTALRWAHETPDIKKLPERKKKKCKTSAFRPPLMAAQNNNRIAAGQGFQVPRAQPANFQQNTANVLQPGSASQALRGVPRLPSLAASMIPRGSAKQAGVLSDAYNAAFGENGLERLQSWNNVKGYLPGSLRSHITETQVNPAIREALWEAGKTGLGLLGGGLLGAYSLIRGLSKPKSPAMGLTQSTIPSLTELTQPLRSVNENLGLTACGRHPDLLKK